MSEPYLEIILDDKIYMQRTSTSKFIEFTLSGEKIQSFEELPNDIKKIIKDINDMKLNPDFYFNYEIIDNEVTITGCKDIEATHIKIPEYIKDYPVTKIQEFNRYTLSNTTQIILPETIKTLGKHCFHNLNKIKYINLPKSVTTIPSHCFNNCKSLTNLDISHVTSIGTCAIRKCEAIKELDASNVINFGEYALSLCNNLKSVKLNKNLTTLTNGLFSGDNELTNINIPNSIKELGDSVFEDCFKLPDIKLPDTLEKIGDYCFFRCYNIKEFNPPKTLKNIGYRGFSRSGLRKITLPKTITTINDYAFAECNNLKEITLYDNSKNIFCGISIPIFEQIKINNLSRTEKGGEVR